MRPNWLIVPSTGQIRSAAAIGRAPSFSARVKKSLKLLYAAASASILITGVAGLVAGAMSMAAGEYVSVHSQADTEAADIARERAELQHDPAAEHRELAAIYVGRGLEPGLADQVSTQLMAHD